MQSSILLKTLKEQLRAHKLTYRDVAKSLGLVESSVKRLMGNGKISLDRLESICELMDLTLSDLFHLMQKQIHLVKQLSVTQEREIVSDTKLLLVTICALNHWRLEDIITYYKLNKAECLQKLLILNKLKIIELLPSNKIKLLIAADFSWIPNGPIQRFFKEHLEADFFGSNFKHPDELFICLNGMLSTDCNHALQQQIKKLADSFSDLKIQSSKTPFTQLKGSALVIGLRPWVPKLFEQFK